MNTKKVTSEQQAMNTSNTPVALITGGAKRIGAAIAQRLHNASYNIILHYHQSSEAAQELIEKLNKQRPDSVIGISADLNQHSDLKSLTVNAQKKWQRIDLLVNNASTFYPTPVESSDEENWNDLINVNLKAPYFLSCLLAEELKKTQGCIINIADIYAEHPLKNYSIYSIAKAGNLMLTKSLAQELAPLVRVNGIAPGAILWPEKIKVSDQQSPSDKNKTTILEKIPLQRTGNPEDIARTLLFLVQDAKYITGQILTVDGGRSISL